MLVHASNVLRSKVDDGEFVARIGGDEFIVLCTVHDDIKQLAVLADRVISQMRAPIYYRAIDAVLVSALELQSTTEKMSKPSTC